MAIGFAYVKFMSDKAKAIVRVRDIKNFKPANVADFNNTKVYLVRWNDERNEDGEGQYYKAQILMLGDTEEHLEEKIDRSRVKVPKVLDTSVEESSDEDERQASSSNAAIRIERKQQKSSKAAAEKRSLQVILEEKLKEKHARPLFEETSHKRPSDELEYMKSLKLAKKYKDELEKIKKEKEDLATEVTEYRLLNRELQMKLHHMEKARSVPGIVSSKNAGKPVAVGLDLQISTKARDNKDDVVDVPSLSSDNGDKQGHLEAADIAISEDKWSYITSQKKPSLFVKSLLVATWGTEILRNRSVEGKVCPRLKKDGREAKPALTPSKLKAIKETFKQHLKTSGYNESEITAECSKFNRYATEKIADLNRPVKRKLEV